MRRLLDGLLLAALFTATFTKLRWGAGPVDLRLGEVVAACFVAVFAAARIYARDWRFSRTVQVIAVFFLLLLAVYLVGYFNLTNITARNLWLKGTLVFTVQFTFLMAAVSWLYRRGEPLFWRSVRWFCAGAAVNAVYGLLSLGYAEARNGADLDAVVIAPITGEDGGIQIFGVAGGFAIYRTSGLTVDPNHLGIMLVVPLLLLLPVYLRLPRGDRWRIPMAVALIGMFLVLLATISRSAFLGLAVGLVILAVPFARTFLTARFLVPVAAMSALIAYIVAQRTAFFERIVLVRTNIGSSQAQTHFGFYDLIGPVLREAPLFGLGRNTFQQYYEFLTGKSNWGPHSYYVNVITESGLVGAAIVGAYLVYVFMRLGVARRLGSALVEAGDSGAELLRAAAWGLTAAIAATMVANLFYLTMQMYYFTSVVALALAISLVLARRARATA